MSRSFPDWFHMRSAESAPAELHAEALDHLFGSQVDPIRRLPDGVAAPSICAGNHRFEVLWDGDRPADRVDRAKEPATAGQASA